jgi:hypothetical protein
MESKTLTEAAVLLRSNETELLRTVVRMAGRSQLSEERLIEILLEAGISNGMRLNERDLHIVAMGLGRRINQNRADSGSVEYL